MMAFHATDRRVATMFAALAVSLALGCSTAPEVKPIHVEEGPGATVTVDGLHKATGSGYELLFVKPDADFDTYDAAMFDPVEISYKRKPRGRRYATTDSNFALTDSQTRLVKKMLQEAFEKQLEKRALYKITDAPGPSVLRIDLAIVDLVVNAPTDPMAGTDYNFVSSTADMTLMMELRDSLSNEILARVGDRQAARQPGAGGSQLYASNAVTNTDAVRRVFDYWAEILAVRLEAVKKIEPTQPLKDSDEQ